MAKDNMHLAPSEGDTHFRLGVDLETFGSNYADIFGHTGAKLAPGDSQAKWKRPKDLRTDLTNTCCPKLDLASYRANHESIFKKPPT